MWIMPLWQSNNSFGVTSGEFEMDSHASIGGIAIGADYTIEQAGRLGLTFNIGGGYAEGSGDLAKTTNNMNFWGVGAYAGWMCDNFGLTADVNYTSTHNNIKQEVDPSFHMQDMESEVMASAISAGLRAEYKFNTEALDIIPHVGVRYIHLTTYGYDVENAGQRVLEANTTRQNIWTFPIGVQFAKSFNLDNGWYVRPSLDLNVTPAAGDIDVKREVRFTGVTASASPETQTMDWITYGGQAGIEFGNDNLKLGVNYSLQAGAHTTNHGVFGTLRYEF